MKVRLSFLFLMGLSLSNLGCVSVGKEVTVANYVNKNSASPWNFFEDFEDKTLNGYTINDKGEGLAPFKFKNDPDGNTYIEITVKHDWNKCCGHPPKTERAEFSPPIKHALNKEIWIGFKIRLPNQFIHIDDRLLVFQFKNQFSPMKKSPLLGIRFYEEGSVLDISGDTGGIASTRWNSKEAKIHKVSSKFFYNKKKNIWTLYEVKKRNEYKTFPPVKMTFTALRKGEWGVIKIGIKNSSKDDGFIKVYMDNELIMNYSGITFDWKGNYTGTVIRLGPYRDRDPLNNGYPPQSIHYDDFIVVSDKKTLDQFLD